MAEPAVRSVDRGRGSHSLNADNSAIMPGVESQLQQVLEAVREAVPPWVVVSAREDVFAGRIEVRLAARGWRAVTSYRRSQVVLARAHSAAASSPPGVAVRVRWA